MQNKMYSKAVLVICLSGFFLGILFTNLVLKKDLAAMDAFQVYFSSQSSQDATKDPGFLLYLLKVRFLPAMLLAAFGATRFRRMISFVFLTWIGFLFGIILTAAICCMGIRGMLLCVVCIIPQILFYVIGYVTLTTALMVNERINLNFKKTITVFLAICIGVAVEYCVNPYLVKIFFFHG